MTEEAVKPEVAPEVLEEIARTEDQATDQQGRMGPTDTAEHVPADKPMTPEEVKALEDVVKVTMEDKWVQGACSVMLAARRIYMATLVDLDNRLKEMKKIKDRDGVRTIITDNLANFARKQEYTRQEVIKATQNVVLPWMMATQQAETEVARVEEAHRQREAEERVKGVAVPIGFAHNFTNDEGFINTVGRQRSLVFMGKPGAVKLLLHSAKVAALKTRETQDAPKMRVLHLSSYDQPYRNVSRRANRDRQELTLGPDQWNGKFANARGGAKFLAGWLRMIKKGRIDLLVVDDLTKLMPERKNRDPHEAAAFAQKFMRTWCNKVGCALVAGLPVTEDMAPGAMPKLSQQGSTLEVYSDLRRIMVCDGEYDPDYECETYDLKLDTGVMPFKGVDRKVIDDHGETTDGEERYLVRLLSEAAESGDGGKRDGGQPTEDAEESGQHPEVVGRSGEAGGGEEGSASECGVDEAPGSD